MPKTSSATDFHSAIRGGHKGSARIGPGRFSRGMAVLTKFATEDVSTLMSYGVEKKPDTCEARIALAQPTSDLPSTELVDTLG